MRKLSFFLMLLCFACFGVARAEEVMIGDAASTSTQYYLPVNMYFHYSLTQQIYTAEEIGRAGTINSIAFDYAYTGSFTMDGVQVYMMNVDKASFESNTDMVSLANAELVWEGTFSATGSGWVTLDLDTPFVYDGTSNLLVCCYDPTRGYPGSAYKFRTTATTDYLGISFHSDSYSPSLTDVSTFSGNKNRFTYRNNIKLDITAGSGPTCTKPSDMLISDVTPTGATVAWTSDVNNYNLEYKKASESEWTSIGLEANTYALTNLTSNTAYNVRVQAVCGTDLTSGWLIGSFSTPAGIPLIEPFATSSVPTGWTKYIGLLDGVMADTIDLVTTGSGWTFNTNNGVFDNHARLNIYSNSCKYWLVTPTIVMEDNVQLDFDLALTKYSGTLTPITDTLGQDDRFVVLIATFGADTTLTILREWDNTGSEYVYNAITCSAVGEHVTIDLSSYAGQNIAIAFYGESTVQETNSDNNLHIDNVSVDYIPACAKPTGVAASDITAHEATLSWVSDAAEWIVAYKATAEEDFTEVTVSETSYSFSGLVPETAYTAKVRANCGGTLSEWSNTANFTTGVACVVPTSFTTSNATNHGATLNWASDADEWIVAYKVTADTDFTEITVSDTTYTFTTLDPETSYTVKVRSNCGNYDGMSAWTSTRSFTTLVACPAPNNFTCTALTLTDATLNWNERGDATEWDLQYWKGTDTTLVVVSEKPYTLTNLIAENVYGARVRSACGSDWSSIITFEPTAKLVIGSGTSNSGNLPSNTNYKYSYTQQIYTVEELGEAGVFESIDFYMTSTNASTRNLVIYMVSTDKNVFENNSDWITVTAADLVFSGEVNFAPASWTTITLDNAFIYDGTQNVAIIVDDNTGVYSSRQFRTFTASASQSHYYYRDNNDIVPNEAGTNGTVTTSKNQIRILKGEMSSCMKPTRFTATEVGPDFAVLSWNENGASEAWVINYGNRAQIEVTENPYTLTGLTPDSHYYLRVRPDCDENLWSDEIEIQTLAACPVPEEVTVSDTTSNAATVTWVGYSDSYNVQLGQKGEPEILLNANFEDQAIPTQFVNDTLYAWALTDTLTDGGYCIRSTNQGVGSSTSAISTTVTFPANGTIEFDAECRGEGSNTAWDKCIFEIDGVAQFTYGAHLTNDGWLHYSFEVAAGEHTFTWKYTKDSSVNPAGDYFAVDNIVMNSIEIIWADPVSVEDTEYTFTGLTPETNYYVTVTGVCDEVQTEASAIVGFTTLAPDPVPEVTVSNSDQTVCLGNSIEDMIITATNGTITSVTGLPTGVDWDGNTTISGAPTQSGSFDATVTVTSNQNPDYGTATATVTITVNPLPEVTVSNDDQKVCQGNSIDDMTITATNGTITSVDGLPTGVTWDGNTTISGAPRQSGTFNATVTVTSDQTPECSTATAEFTLIVNPLPVVTVTNDVQTVCMNSAITDMEITATNANIISVDGLPAGVSWSGTTISGTPTESGMFDVTVTVTSDKTPDCGDATTIATITVNPLPEVTVTNDVQTVYLNSAITDMEITATNANIISVDDLPAGVEWSGTTISGAPIESGTFNATVMVDSYYGCGIGMAELTIIVNPLPVAYTLDITGYGDSDGGWNLIASPLAESIAATEVGNLVAETASDFDLYRFNQAANMEWENWKQEESEHYHFNLESGRGYLYASKEDVTLIFTGEPYSGDGEVALSKTTGVDFEGWNLVGNPFNDTAYIERPFYIMNSSGSEIIAAADVEQNSIAPMEGVFVIANEDGETLTFTTEAPTNKGKGLALNLSQGRGVIDRAIVRFGEGQQLPKFQLRESSTKVYIPQDNKDYAVVNVGRDAMHCVSTEIPVHFKARENGVYTLTVSETFSSQLSAFSYLHLIDNLTGNDVDLLETQSYTFEAKVTDYASRFKLVFATGDADNSEDFAFISNGNIIINGEGTLQVIDALGRILLTQKNTTANCKLSTANYKPGVYVLRLINGEDVKTQKIVIK